MQVYHITGKDGRSIDVIDDACSAIFPYRLVAAFAAKNGFIEYKIKMGEKLNDRNT